MINCSINRRRFIQTLPLAASAASLVSWAAEDKSRIVEIHRLGILQENNRPDAAGTQEMLDKGMREFTGEKSRRDQWAKFVSNDDVVGLKVNGLGGALMCTKKELIQAVIQGLLDAGVKENNIIVWDNRSSYVAATGFAENLGKTGVRVYASENPEIGHDKNATEIEAGSTHLSKILTEQITALINLPIMKDHPIAGTTLSLKNISHGATDNPDAFHGEKCHPCIAQINALPAVRSKHRLVVMDALLGCCDGGPRYKASGVEKYESIFITTDCVAIDALGTERIEAARKAKGLPSLAERGLSTNYIALAAKAGLGANEKSKIALQQMEG